MTDAEIVELALHRVADQREAANPELADALRDLAAQICILVVEKRK